MSTFATNDDWTNLGWFFNDAEGCLGLAGIDYGAVGGGSPAATSEAAERKAEFMLSSAERYRKIAAALNKLNIRQQRALQNAFVRGKVPLALANKPPTHVHAACSSVAAREFLTERGRQWSLPLAREWLAKAERPKEDMGVPIPRLVAFRIAAWSEAESFIDALLDTYATARRDAYLEAAAVRIAQARKLARGAA